MQMMMVEAVPSLPLIFDFISELEPGTGAVAQPASAAKLRHGVTDQRTDLAINTDDSKVGCIV